MFSWEDTESRSVTGSLRSPATDGSVDSYDAASTYRYQQDQVSCLQFEL